MSNVKNYLPIFPEFKPIEFRDKTIIEEFTSRFPPYSDFTFTSLWSWTTNKNTFISLLNNNLVIKFNDYVTNEPFLTFIGTKKILATTKLLITYAQENKLLKELKLIPEINIQMASPSFFRQYQIQEDRDNFDYVYSINQTIELKGSCLGPKRNFINRFKKKYKFIHKLLNLTNSHHRQEILQLFETWRKERIKDPMEIQNELKAIIRVFRCSHFSNLLTLGIFIDHQLVGFSINEILTQGYAMNLFEKANITFEGIFPYLRYITAFYLSQHGCQFLNHEQDLGILGLRQSKMSYAPKFFLRKYIISPKP